MNKNSIINRTNPLDRYNIKVSFSELETQCILELLQHHSLTEVATNLQLNPKTICFYLVNAGQKLVNLGKNRPG